MMSGKNCTGCTYENTVDLFSGSAAAVGSHPEPIAQGSPVQAAASAELETLKREKTYDLIYCDPPWRYKDGKNPYGGVDKHYGTMSLEDIKNYPVPAKDNSILFLWVTSPMVREGIEVMDAWNFKYKYSAVWDKVWITGGNCFRIQHEFIFIGVKGGFKITEHRKDKSISSVIVEKRSSKHSKKPVKMYEAIEKLFPHLSKIELFARNLRPGWTSRGNEIDNNNLIGGNVL